MAQLINVDLDKLLDIALKGVRRAAVFMGLGVNAALDATFKSYQLTALTNIQLIPDDVSAETLRHFKEEFRIWIEAGGFRELADTFATYLDAVHHTCLVMKAVKAQSSLAEVPEIQAKYRNEGFPNKLNVVSQRFGVRPERPAHLVSLSQARNCLTHRQGVVGDEDLREAAEFSVQWLGLDMFVEEPNGTRHPFNEIPPDGLFLPDGGTVIAQFAERCRAFKRGEKLILSTRDLAEVCWLYEGEARTVLRGVLEFAKSIGLDVQQTGT